LSLGRRLLGVAALLALPACGCSNPQPMPTPTPNYCTSAPSAYGQAVISWWVPQCSLAQNIYNNPAETLGAPNAAGSGPDHYTGFMSLGFGGYVTVDLGGCITDQPGNDLRVFQAVSSEPVSVYVATAPEGPYTFLDRKACGERVDRVIGYCDFDLATGGVSQARYIKVEDGELYPCPGGTVTEGADLDAVQALAVPVTSGAAPLP
jgi:hypothetical protein